MTYQGQIAESVRFAGHEGDDGYYARPLGPGPHLAMPR